MAIKSEIFQELKTSLQDGTLIVGTEECMKALRSSKLKKVLLASNCKESIKSEMEHYAKIAGVEVSVLEQDNEELGVLCKRNYFVAVVGIK